jgi:hypothetical protein
MKSACLAHMLVAAFLGARAPAGNLHGSSWPVASGGNSILHGALLSTMSCARQGNAESLLRGLPVVQAAELPKGSMERLLLVAAFAQIGYSAGLRPYKCFNPVMGETFEV